MQSYIEVVIADPAYHGKDVLTYSSNTPLSVGAIVSVPLRSKSVLAIVIATVKKPSFAAKSILEIAIELPLPEELVKLISWMQGYYGSTIGATTQLFVPSRIVRPDPQISFENPSTKNLPGLTNEQTH
jgi:primosomal protein N'